MANTERVALVTGVGKSTGIGFALCEKLAQAGFKVVLTARQEQSADTLAAQLNARFPESTTAFQLDVSKLDDVAALRDWVESRFGKLDLLINNAAALSPFGEKAATANLDASQRVMDVILFGTWRLCQALLPALRRSEAGRIVNVSSGAGSHGDKAFGLATDNMMGTSYGVAKAALNALTVIMAREEKTPSLRINAVCPGFTATFEGAEAMGARPVSAGADSVLWAALIDNDGPTGGFFRDGKPLDW
jgi:NAD(P)-dependent dehydrogenase (short-subunit alcohol dehydrogenase family)